MQISKNSPEEEMGKKCMRNLLNYINDKTGKNCCNISTKRASSDVFWNSSFLKLCICYYYCFILHALSYLSSVIQYGSEKRRLASLNNCLNIMQEDNKYMASTNDGPDLKNLIFETTAHIEISDTWIQRKICPAF